MRARIAAVALAVLATALIAQPQQSTQGVASVKVRSKLVITSPLILPEAYEGTPYSFQFAATGGKPPYTWSATNCVKVLPDGTTTNCASATAGALVPGGLTLTPAGVLYGTPSESGNFNISVAVQDSK